LLLNIDTQIEKLTPASEYMEKGWPMGKGVYLIGEMIYEVLKYMLIYVICLNKMQF
jgi:predicted nucleotide-binding protein (sugar kinase/HSP70/actin superfamily)